MAISINPVLPVLPAQEAGGVAPELVLQPGSVVNAQVLKVLSADLVRIAIASLSIDVATEIPLQQGQNLQLAVMQTKDGIRLAMVGQGGGAGGASADAVTRVRHLIGVDPNRGAVAIADNVEAGVQLTFCARDVEAARRDLVRICSEVREEAESHVAIAGNESVPAARRIAGAIYVSCTGRGGAHFGAPSAELQTVRRALGDVPLVGFYAAGEIARHHLYGYTGVLTAFLD